ncbi:MAG: restriction endonuclease subunit S, partial [Phocaeicola sp.]
IVGTMQYILPKTNVDINYLCYVLRQLDLAKYASGATIPHIYFKDYSKENVFLPPISKQQEIAAILDKASELVEKRKAQLAELDTLAESIFYDMFGDPVTNEKGWEKKELGKICDVGSSKRVFVEELVESGIPFYRGTEIGSISLEGKIKPSLFITKEHYSKLVKESGIPKIGDLLMPSICPDGRIMIVKDNEPFYFKDGRVLWIKINDSIICSFYLKALLKALFAVQYEQIASGTTFAELKIFILKGLSILLPPLPLQQQFAQRIEKIEAQKQKVKAALKESEELFQRLMQDLFKPM